MKNEVRLGISFTMREPENKLPRPFRAQEWVFSWSLQEDFIMANILVLAF